MRVTQLCLAWLVAKADDEDGTKVEVEDIKVAINIADKVASHIDGNLEAVIC